MLDIALKYKDELQKLYLNTWHQDKYKYYNYNSYWSALELKANTWDAHEFVSVDKDGNVLGFIFYSIDRSSNSACSLGIINFSDSSLTFGKDVLQTIKDVFEKYNFHKLSFALLSAILSKRPMINLRLDMAVVSLVSKSHTQNCVIINTTMSKDMKSCAKTI